jgi:succinoglycan biosynthesis protein ExoV
MLYYCKTPMGNLGDDLNPWLWSRLAPEVCDDRASALFVGIGTILSHRMPAEPLKFVFGAGWGGGRRPKIDRKWMIYCVRGPLTAAGLKLDPALAIADPAILVRRVPRAAAKKCYPISFMPHHQSMPLADWKALCAQVGFHCINPCGGVDKVLAEVEQTELLLAEAMHGAIVADALRVPWIPVRMYGRFTEFKWRDWTQSIQAPLRIVDIAPIFERGPALWKRLDYAVKKTVARAGLGDDNWNRLGVRLSTRREISQTLRALEKTPKEQTPCLSADETIARLETRLCDKLTGLRAAWQNGQFTPPKTPADVETGKNG